MSGSRARQRRDTPDPGGLTRRSTIAPTAVAPPPLSRDPWAWVTVLAIVPVLVHSRGAPFGEPAAEDFDFLHHSLLLHRHGLLDGGGSAAFWRPLAHQVYYTVFGKLILSSPHLIAVVHALLVTGTALLVYRALRHGWPGWQATAAASFALLAESTRVLIVWPSLFTDVGTTFFAALALHQAAFRRFRTALLALAGSLLCKETGVVVALMLPWLPVLGPVGQRERRLWAAATGGLVVAWGLLYLYVRNQAGLELPHGLETSAEVAAVPWLARFGWALWNTLRAALSMPAAPTPGEWLYGMGVLALGGFLGTRVAGLFLALGKFL